MLESGRFKTQTEFFDMNFMAETIFELVKIGNVLDKYINLGDHQVWFCFWKVALCFRAKERIKAIRVGTIQEWLFLHQSLKVH